MENTKIPNVQMLKVDTRQDLNINFKFVLLDPHVNRTVGSGVARVDAAPVGKGNSFWRPLPKSKI